MKRKHISNLYIDIRGPATSEDGDMWYNTFDHRTYEFGHGAWHRLPTREDKILAYYQDKGVSAMYCIDCAARGTSASTPDNDLYFCYILERDIETRQCTNYDWNKFILEHI